MIRFGRRVNEKEIFDVMFHAYDINPITPGPIDAGSDVAAIVTSIGVSGNREVSTSEILAVIKATQVGEPLDEQKLMQDMQAITEMGYFSLVEVEPSFYLGE